MTPEVYHIYEGFHQIPFITNHTYLIIILLEILLLSIFFSLRKLFKKKLYSNQKKLHLGICIDT